MNTPRIPSPRRPAAVGALLLLVATASGWGVGLPTQPSLDQTAGDDRVATSLGAESPTPWKRSRPPASAAASSSALRCSRLLTPRSR